ncbi:hypothetical protein [Haloferula sargassicola]
MNKKYPLAILILAGSVSVVLLIKKGDQEEQRHQGQLLGGGRDNEEPFEKLSHGSSGQIPRQSGGGVREVNDIEALRKSLASLLSSEEAFDDRAEKAAPIIKELAKLLPASEVIDLISGHLGDGGERDLLLPLIFAESTETEEKLISVVSGLTPDSASVAVIGLIPRILDKERSSELMGQLLSENPEQKILDTLTHSLRVELSNASANADRLHEFAKLFEGMEGDAKMKFFESLSEAASKASPKEFWSLLDNKSGSENYDPEWVEQARIKISIQLRLNDPRDAAKFLIGNDAPDREIAHAIAAWEAMSPQTFQNWLADNPVDSIEGKAGIIAGMAIRAVDSGDLKAAKDYMGEIDAPDLRDELNGRLWKLEQTLVQKEVSRDPEATVSDLASGRSSFEGFWLEEAMGSWVAMDFVSATEWYEKKWDSLPPEKAQFVAAAFAKQSAEQGDLETARQWAEFIQDPKTKERIDVEIANAAGQ